MHSILDLIYQWSRDNLDIVFFVYGLAFVVMGIAILVQPKKESGFKLAKILWLLAGFGLTHGTNELLDMWAIIKGNSLILDVARFFILIISYLFLFEFGRRILSICGHKPLEKISNLFSGGLTFIVGALVIILGLISTNFWEIEITWARYLLGFPAGILTSLGFILYYKYGEKELASLRVGKYFFWAGLFFSVYGILGGLITPKADFFPANLVNTDSFLSVVHIPVQVFRAVCSVIITWGVCGILRIFKWEALEKLQIEITERKSAEEKLKGAYGGLEAAIRERTKELSAANELLKVEVTERKNTEEELQHNYASQNAINSLLHLSVKDISLDEFLRQALELIIAVPQFSLEPKGAIFLVEDKPGFLVMKSQKGINTLLQSMCSQIPFGKCLCGQAALTRKVQFANHIDERHEITFNGITPHGHYCVPILSLGEILGVLNLYIKENREFDKKEEDFLIAIADTLAGVIKRKKAEEELKNAYTNLKETQDQLIQAEKLNAIGKLASGIAHEVRNPLGIILQGVNLLENNIHECEGEIGIGETLGLMKENITRADKIINALFDFSKAGSIDLKEEDVNSILEVSLSLVKARKGFENIDIIMETKEGLPKIMADKNKLEQVFINILLNAAQAMPQGGRLTVRSYDEVIKGKAKAAGKDEEGYFRPREKAVIVEIEDTGSGISENNLKKIFDPFFTTKGPAGGAGLGLSVTKNIIAMHKGLIDVKSKVGQGTKVAVTLKTKEGLTPA